MNERKESQDIQSELNDRQATPRRKLPGRKLAVAVGWGALAVAVLAGVYWKLWSPLPVTTLHPQPGALREEAFGTGTLEAKVVVALGAKITGRVAEVLVDQGDTVTNGQTVARLEAKDFEDAVRVAEASLGQAQAELAKAQLDLKRDRELMQSSAIPQSEFDATETACRVAEARVKTAEAVLGVARARRADTQIVSPVSGLVITRNLEVGSTVVPGAPIFRVADTSVMWVVAQVDEREAGRVRLGQTTRVVFETNPDSPAIGRVARLSMEVDRVTEEREVDVALDQLPRDFFLGEKADVYIETSRKDNALQIPVNTLVVRDGKTGVFVASHGRARWKLIQVGFRSRDAVEVVNGVNEHDSVIVEPLANKKPISDGARVAVKNSQDKS